MTVPVHVNFSEKEASSAAFDVLPRGKYHVKITDIEPRQSKSEKNAGKWYWHMEFTIQEGEFHGRKLWTNVMLFEGALYTLKQLLEALGTTVKGAGKAELPPAEFFLGKDVVVRITITPETKDYDEKNEVKAIYAYDGGDVSKAKGGKSSLLPG